MINLKFHYKPLFTIKINHNYYPEDSANDFYIVPTKRTVSLIDKMAMLLKSKEGEIHVLFDFSRLELLHHRLINSNDSDSKFSFMLYSNNPYFVNITDVPVDLKDKVFYCSNKAATEKNSKLHNKEFIESEDLFQIIPQELENNEEGKIEYKIVLENGELDEKMPLAKINNGFQIDASRLIEGHYKIFGNDKELSSFINIEPKTKGSPIGYIDIFLNKQIKQELIKGIENEELKTYNYTINFNSRSIFWKYVVVPTYLKRAKELSVICQKGKDKLVFKNIGEENINDKKAISFMSMELVKLKKIYEYEIQLRKQGSESGGKTLIKKMSYAPFDLLKPVDDKNYMSEIYVYI